MSNRAVLLLAAMACALVVASGVALAAVIQCTTNPCVGTEEDDEITGTEGAERIDALGGADFVDALGGNDRIDAGANPDFPAFFDRVFGGDGNDTILGQEGPDSIFGDGRVGDEGNDIILGGPGSTTNYSLLDGGPGDDSIVGGADKDEVRTGAGTNFGFGLGGDDYIVLYDIDSQDPNPTSQDDFGSGGGGDDFIFAQDGTRDFISCGAGTDTVGSADEEDVVASDCENAPTAAITATAATEAEMRDLEAKVERWAKRLQEKSQQQASTSRRK